VKILRLTHTAKRATISTVDLIDIFQYLCFCEEFGIQQVVDVLSSYFNQTLSVLSFVNWPNI